MVRKRRRRLNTSLSSSTIRFVFNRYKIPEIIKQEAKKRKQIVYGSQAMNIQLPGFARRLAFDWDVFTRQPKRTANRMQKKLDREAAGGRDDYYMKRAKHPGTYRVMHEGWDGRQNTKDDFNIVDYTKMPRRKPKTIKRRGVRYQRLSSISKEKRKMIKQKESKFRREKDVRDIKIIHAVNSLKKLRL